MKKYLFFYAVAVTALLVYGYGPATAAKTAA